ncbi:MULTISPECIES: hypothetical protein [Mesorhizobium]|uniref:hypothetical protein n=1 Tax=Mesorhizobium TaxID=68287 RepID=UPI001140F04E|nr:MULTISPECIES: hypothetical protein [Mesorhizobium]QIA25322.1 hypothetical protein A9K68_028875 [Mesorhizobium sp. AA22]
MTAYLLADGVRVEILDAGGNAIDAAGEQRPGLRFRDSIDYRDDRAGKTAGSDAKGRCHSTNPHRGKRPFGRGIAALTEEVADY